MTPQDSPKLADYIVDCKSTGKLDLLISEAESGVSEANLLRFENLTRLSWVSDQVEDQRIHAPEVVERLSGAIHKCALRIHNNETLAVSNLTGMNAALLLRRNYKFVGEVQITGNLTENQVPFLIERARSYGFNPTVDESLGPMEENTTLETRKRSREDAGESVNNLTHLVNFDVYIGCYVT